nr:MAG TPA: hypothetical protein [Caudoviricetes sp.]
MKVKILSSHIIRSNKHRDQIKSAITDPINHELVQQLSEYIDWDDVDEEVIDELKGEDNEDDVSEEEVPEEHIDDEDKPEEDKPHKPDKLDKPTNPDSAKPDKLDKPEEDKAEEPELESATKIPTNKIESAIKTTLTQLQSSKDINLISIKGNEIWVRYNDTVNLNDIMYDTIKYVTDNTDLTFNRLARFDNSIVFIQ